MIASKRLFNLLLIVIIFIISVACIQILKTINSLEKHDDKFKELKSDLIENFETFYFNTSCDCRKKNQIKLVKYEDYSVVRFQNEYKRFKYLYSISNEDLIRTTFTCNLYASLRRGKSQKVLSYSLYGKRKFFYDKLKILTKQMKIFYPGWYMRIYHDNTIDKSIICDLECQKDEDGGYLDNVDFCDINNIELKVNYSKLVGDLDLNGTYIHAAIWRWLPIGDSFVDVFSSRDTDSYLIQREIDSVNVWLKSDKTGHIMRDHPHHGTEIMAGMWGFYNARDRELSKRIYKQITNREISWLYNENNSNKKGSDQAFLSTFVYPFIRNNSITHDSYLCTIYGGSPFPTQRIGDCFIGGVTECSANKTFEYECPLKCRPRNHYWPTC